jgi:hypothetical protein
VSLIFRAREDEIALSKKSESVSLRSDMEAV